MKPRSYITFPIFDKFSDLICVLSTRSGGYSQGIYGSQNMGLRSGDTVSVVEKNRKQFFGLFKISQQQIAFTDQIHSANVAVADRSGVYPASDALVTSQTGQFLAIQTADCLPVFVVDPENRVIAAVHAGWRGVQAGIISRVIAVMTGTWQLDPQKFYAAVGPGLQKECFEVGADVAGLFPRTFLSDHRDPAKSYLDLAGYTVSLLRQAGIPDSQIENNGACTMCDQGAYYSYRRDKMQSGRMIGIIGMTGENKL